MKKQVILCLKVGWAVAALMTLLMAANVCTSGDQACRAASDTTLFFMGLLTFPTGLVCILVSAVVCGLIGGQYPEGYLMAWFVLACGGCLQWFVMVPLCLEKPALTVLNLNSNPTASSKDLQPKPANTHCVIDTPKPLNPPVIQMPVKIRVRKDHNRIRSFDRLGRSPLERIISR